MNIFAVATHTAVKTEPVLSLVSVKLEARVDVSSR